jgi:hypothetical protein
MPTPSACDHTNFVAPSSGTLSPGTYCGGLSIANGANVALAAGTYIINGGTFDISGGAKVDASAGVTAVMTGSGSNYAQFEVDNGADVNWVAPASGATSGIPGIAVFQDRNTPQGVVSFAGGAKSDFTGALYFPSMTVNFANGSTNNSTCTQLIADQVTFAGGSKFGNTCAGTGVTAIGASSTKLVE